ARRVKRFLVLFALLAAVHLVVREAVAVGVFRHVDARYVAFAQMISVPGLQAAVLALVGKPEPERAAVSSLLRRPLLLALAGGELAVLAAACLFPGVPLLALGGRIPSAV